MRMSVKKKHLAIGTVAAVAAAGLGGAALAYWTSTGTGSGTATTGTSSQFTVAVTAASGNAALTPGGPTDTYNFTVTNAGTGKQRVTAASASVANSDGTTWTSVSGCSAADYTVSAATVTAATLASGASTSGSFTIQMIDSGANQDACKGATVPLYVSVS